jgi:DNA-directed RNA polymerase specialized sigma24 family protein
MSLEPERPCDPDWRILSDWLHMVGRQLARRFCVDEFLVEDAAQDALLDYLQEQAAGRPVRLLRPWLRRVLLNRLLNRLRRRSRRRTQRLEAVELIGPERSPEEFALGREVWRQFLGRVGRLPSPWREVVVLRRLHGWSRSQTVAWLQRWREELSATRMRRIVCEANLMLRSLWDGDAPELRWPQRYDPRRNQWLATPPRGCRVSEMWSGSQTPVARRADPAPGRREPLLP